MANMVKTPDELMKILKAATMGDMCFTHILQFIEPGMTEKMVADEIEKTLLGYGADCPSRRSVCPASTRLSPTENLAIK